MKHWINAGVALTATLACTACSTSLTAPVSPPPDIVFILVDDLGWSDLGCYGSDLYETPNIDRLAEAGMRFTNAYAAAAICSPTRASIMTGKYPARLQITDWIPGVRYPHAPLSTPEFRQEMALEEVTIAEALRSAGYVNLHVGKWHLGGEDFYPLAQGFDVNVGGHSKGAPATYFHPYQSKPGARVDWGVRNLPAGGESGEYLTDRLGDEAIRLLEEHHERPFFLHLSFYTVHTPIEGKPEYVEHYKERVHAGLRQKNPTYAAMVKSMDENVGRVLDTLDRLGVAGNTVVFFTSDNGGVHGVTNNAPLRAGKGFLYEGGIREPLIVRWPNVVRRTTSSAIVSSVDFYPTILDIMEAGGAPAREYNETLDGESLLGTLRDPSDEPHRDGIFWHYPHYHTPKRPPTGAVRSGDYKLLEFYEDDRVELYNLRDDIGESVDLSQRQPERVGQLRAMLDAWRVRVGAAMPVPNTAFDPGQPFRGAFTAWESTTPAWLRKSDIPGR